MTKRQNMKKQALDEAAKKYWEEYFKDYGKLWVRDIPRKITAHLATSVRRHATVKKQITVEGEALPLWGKEQADGSLFVEGAFKGQVANGKQIRLMWAALFDADGKILKYEDTDLSSIIRG